MTKTCGWAPVGDRLIDHAPAGRWNTQTFITGLRHDRIDATGVIHGAMDREMFKLYVEGILAPTLRSGDVVILDNLPAPKRRCSAQNPQRHRCVFLAPAQVPPRYQSHRNGLLKAASPHSEGSGMYV